MNHPPYTNQSLKRLLSALLLCLLLTTGRAQETYSLYPFIHSNLNRLYFSSDSSAFKNFYSKLDKLKEEKNERITLVHMGGSHVQGGVWSNTFLSDFQNNNQTSGGGYFSFPYKIAKTNQQPFVSSFSSGNWKKCRAVGKEFCLPLGMSAMNVSTNDSSLYFGLSLTIKAACRSVNQIKVYHNFNPSFEFKLCLNDSFKVSRQDVKENEYSLFTFNYAIDSLCFQLIRNDTLQKDFVLYGFSLENTLNSGFYLAALGANGATSSSFLRCASLIPQLQSLQGDLFIISLGVNDTQSKSFEKEDYIENYDSLIGFIKKSNPEACIILTTTTDNFIKRKTSNKRTITAREAMFELMNKHQVAVWDLFSIMGGYKSMNKWFAKGLASKDKVHFTNKGYTIVGNLMYDAVNKAYGNYKLKN